MADVQWPGGLSCPVCDASLAAGSGVLRCAAGHSYDIARQGYVNMLPPKAHIGTADTPEMVASRDVFLASGHYRPIAERVAELVATAVGERPGAIVEVGAGTGEYLAAVLDRMTTRSGIAFDISKHACRRAAGAHERMRAVVCDAWGRLPLRDGSAAAVMSIFAPRNPVEFARVLAGGGALVVVTPTAEHLGSLVRGLGLVRVDPRKDERLEAQLSPRFGCVSSEHIERRLRLSRAEAAAAVAMGPSARHCPFERLQEASGAMPEPLEALLSVRISVWRTLL
ncbi:MAG: putative RNA methyltransferase [Coriobacteriia bacterium]